MFFPNSVGFGVFGHSKGLPSPLPFLGADLCLRKGCVEGSPNSSMHLSPSSPNSSLYLFLTLLWFSGAVSWGRSLSFRFCGGFPHHFFTFVSQFLQLFFSFFPNGPTALALGSSTMVKVGSLQQMAFASQKVVWSVPQTVRYIRLFWGKFLLLQKRFCGGFPQLFFPFVSPAVASEKGLVPLTVVYICCPVSCGQSCMTCLNHTPPVCTKRPIMSLLLGYSLG